MNLDLELLRKDIENKIKIEDLTCGSSQKKYVIARAIFTKIAAKDNKLNNSDIARFLKKDHATVLHSKKLFGYYMSRNKPFREIYEALNPSDFVIEKNLSDITIQKLRLQVLELQNKLKTHSGTRLKHSHYPLLEILNNIPDYHVQTVKMRLEPIVKMLEKPSIHNYLPQLN